jgi:hypothetical protein
MQIMDGQAAGGGGCGFCGLKSKHNIQRCPNKLQHGDHLKERSPGGIQEKILNNRIVTLLPASHHASHLPILKSLFERDKVACVHLFVDSNRQCTDIENQVALVTMLGKGGLILDDMDNRLVEIIVALDWISRYALSGPGTSAKNLKKFSKVFLAIPGTVQVAPAMAELHLPHASTNVETTGVTEEV